MEEDGNVGRREGGVGSITKPINLYCNLYEIYPLHVNLKKTNNKTPTKHKTKKQKFLAALEDGVGSIDLDIGQVLRQS